jgi:hypothetical protein
VNFSWNQLEFHPESGGIHWNSTHIPADSNRIPLIFRQIPTEFHSYSGGFRRNDEIPCIFRRNALEYGIPAIPADSKWNSGIPLESAGFCRNPWGRVKYCLTLPLVFPPESGGLPKSHSSPGKVRHSGYSPGGIQWDYCIPTLVRSFPLDSRWNPVGILYSNSSLAVS